MNSRGCRACVEGGSCAILRAKYPIMHEKVEKQTNNSRVRRKGRMVTIPFARGKHMQFAVVLVIYDII